MRAGVAAVVRLAIMEEHLLTRHRVLKLLGVLEFLLREYKDQMGPAAFARVQAAVDEFNARG